MEINYICETCDEWITHDDVPNHTSKGHKVMILERKP